jgi:hypothetical protein
MSVDEFFKSNTVWWNDPESGSIDKCPYNTGYSRHTVLDENPLFNEFLPIINQYVVTIDGQEAVSKSFEYGTIGTTSTDELSGRLITQFIDRVSPCMSSDPSFSFKMIGKYARSLSKGAKTYMTQRFYLMTITASRFALIDLRSHEVQAAQPGRPQPWRPQGSAATRRE